MSRITVEFNEAAMAALRKGPAELAEEVKQAAVVEWYAEGRISQSKAAELLDMSRARFLDELSRRSAPAVQVQARLGIGGQEGTIEGCTKCLHKRLNF